MITTPTLHDILEMEYPMCAFEGYKHGYFRQEVAQAMIDNSRQGYMTPETKDLYRQGTPVLMKDGQTISQP